MAQNNNFQPADAAYCQAVKDNYGLTMTVLYDPTGLMQAYGTNAEYFVTDETATIVWNEKYGGNQAWAVVDTELAD